jgi:hypothetical protein
MSRPNAEPPRISFQMVERKVGDLWVDPNVQRTLRKARVTKIADEFQASALGVLTTSYRSPKRIHIIDGQHRYRAAEAAAYTGVIQTMEYKGLTVPEEAALDPAAVHLAAILSEHGWEISSNSAEGRLTAVAALERVYAMDPNAAKATLHVLTKAYGRRPAAVQGSLLVGLGRVFAKYGTGADGVNLDDLSDRLSKVPGGPDGLLGNARGQKLTRTGDLSTQVARIVVDLYNQRRRTTALTRWE